MSTVTAPPARPPSSSWIKRTLSDRIVWIGLAVWVVFSAAIPYLAQGAIPFDQPMLAAMPYRTRVMIEIFGPVVAFIFMGVAYALTREWTRIGRSLAADIRFDDPTVSRRHALIVRQPDGLRVLDDRSLNGVFVNGERVEWSTLADGDEVVIGRHHLHFVDVPVISGMRAGHTSDHGAAAQTG